MALDRRGALSSSDREALATHLQRCAECRITWQLMSDFEHSGAPAPGDELVFGRAARAVLAKRPGRRPRAFRLALAAAVVLLMAGAASGAVLLGGRLLTPSGERDELHRRSGSKLRRAPGQTVPSIPSRAPEAPAAPAERVSGPDAPPRPLGRGKSVASLGNESRVEPGPLEDAAAVFVRAVKERAQGRRRASIATFRSLQQQFPQTPEAVVSQVSLGDLLLDGGDAAAALVAFDAYLGVLPSGPLATEALLGKARALSALGRGTEADTIRREIARRFPDSPYVRQGVGKQQKGGAP
jgi:TolA-binding protein